MGSDIGGEVLSGDDGKVVLEVEGEFGSNYGISVDRYFKAVINLIIDDSVD